LIHLTANRFLLDFCLFAPPLACGCVQIRSYILSFRNGIGAVFSFATSPRFSSAISMAHGFTGVSAMVCGFFLWKSLMPRSNFPPTLASSGK
jgi:hypothetical protein